MIGLCFKCSRLLQWMWCDSYWGCGWYLGCDSCHYCDHTSFSPDSDETDSIQP